MSISAKKATYQLYNYQLGIRFLEFRTSSITLAERAVRPPGAFRASERLRLQSPVHGRNGILAIETKIPDMWH